MEGVLLTFTAKARRKESRLQRRSISRKTESFPFFNDIFDIFDSLFYDTFDI